MNVEDAVLAPRFHHQWLPDEIVYEYRGLSPDTTAILHQQGYRLREAKEAQGAVAAVRFDAENDLLEGAFDRRTPDGAAVGW